MDRVVYLLSVVLAMGCGVEDALSPGGADDDDDCGQNCPADDPDGPVAPTSGIDGVFGVPNLDDDNGNGPDWDEPPFAGDDDLSTLALSEDELDLLVPGEELALSLSGDTTRIRIYRGQELVLGDGAPGGDYRFTPSAGELTLVVELADYLVAGTLAIENPGRGDGIEIALQAAPLIVNHHLQPAERVWAVRVSDPGYDNAAFIAAYEAVLGDRFTAVSGPEVDWDVWMQDEFEFATATGAQGQRLDIVIDSIRDRGLAAYTRALLGESTIAQTWGVVDDATTYDSFGNLEASPPVTVDGTYYPFGRIYYGRQDGTGLHTQLASFLASQKIQAPFELPTSWLCVGHVDEYSSFVPDPGSDKGFKLLLADVPSALEVLDGLPAGAPLPRYAADYGYATVGALRDDAALIALNEAIQADHLDPIAERFKTELGLTDDDIIRVPTLFERVSDCGGTVAALIPGMVNLVVADDGQTTHLFVPDPFFRDGDDASADPFVEAFRARMPDGLELHFVDNWNVYHLGLGEVHCGTNVQRSPIESWWDAGQPLLGAN